MNLQQYPNFYIICHSMSHLKHTEGILFGSPDVSNQLQKDGGCRRADVAAQQQRGLGSQLLRLHRVHGHRQRQLQEDKADQWYCGGDGNDSLCGKEACATELRMEDKLH